jgi:hypothetical protein
MCSRSTSEPSRQRLAPHDALVDFQLRRLPSVVRSTRCGRAVREVDLLMETKLLDEVQLILRDVFDRNHGTSIQSRVRGVRLS